MKKKKLFGVSSSLTKGIRDTIHAVENNIDSFRFSVVSIDQIELDPENPRDLAVTFEDIHHGLDRNDPLYAKKKLEFESLETLSNTIKLKGLINPIVLYKFGNRYRLVAGERRYLATALAKKEDIQARILSDKPTQFDIKLLQWIENQEREDLSLRERLDNIKAIMNAYQASSDHREMTATNLKDTIGLSLSQANAYYHVLHGPSDLLQAIANDDIKNLDKAVVIAAIKTTALRQDAITSCKEGASLKELKKFIQLEASQNLSVKKSPGRSPRKINLGSTTNSQVIKNLITTIINLPSFKSHAPKFKSIQWSDAKQVSQAFKELLTLF